MILPVTHDNWPDMIRHLESVYVGHNFTSYSFYNYYYMDSWDGDSKTGDNEIGDVPDFFHMLRHIYRTSYHTPFPLFKSLVKTREVKTLFSHFPTSCLKGSCHYRRIDPQIGYLAHYRKTCQVGESLELACSKGVFLKETYALLSFACRLNSPTTFARSS